MPKHRFLQQKHSGFTLVELVVVIILVSVLAVNVVSRISDTSGYAEYTFQARLISALRNMQTRAMHDNRADYCFQINFDTSNTAPAFGPPTLDYITVDSAVVAATCASNIDFNNSNYLTTSATEMSDEGVSLTTTPSFTFINFNSLGQPVDGNDALACTGSSGCRVTFTNESAVSVCVESQGYIHACD